MEWEDQDQEQEHEQEAETGMRHFFNRVLADWTVPHGGLGGQASFGDPAELFLSNKQPRFSPGLFRYFYALLMKAGLRVLDRLLALLAPIAASQHPEGAHEQQSNRAGLWNSLHRCSVEC